MRYLSLLFSSYPYKVSTKSRQSRGPMKIISKLLILKGNYFHLFSLFFRFFQVLNIIRHYCDKEVFIISYLDPSPKVHRVFVGA